MKNKMLLANGETIAYLEQGHGKQVIILIHGNLSSSVYFRPLLKRLPENLRVIAMDLRGFGDSTYHKHITSLKDLADDVSMLMNALMIEKAVIVGWSLGGGVAMEFAAAYPQKTTKLVLIDSTTHKGYPIFKKNAAFQPVVGQIYESAEEMATDPVQIKPVIDAISAKNAAFLAYIYDLTIYTKNKPTPEANAEYIAETMKQRNLADVDYALACLNMGVEPNFYRPGMKTIQNIKCPVLHFWGTLDKTVPEYMVLENLKALEKQSRYVKFSDCGHSTLVANPDELALSLLDFIKF
ncbi:MAG: alpha/beta hydrolase [Bacteroidales bacterium]